MAKHNVIMGTATGSVGDVTLMRRNGVQVARARVREVANPKTTAQAIQRNFVAPVAKFYAPLATMLEKSYEGLSKSKSYRAFLKKNIDISRKNGWYLPKGTPFFPLPYQLSRGTVAPLDYRVDENGTPAAFYLNAGGVAGATVDNLTVGQFSQALYKKGYKANDQITVIVIINQGDGEFIPAYCRFYLSADSTTLLKDSLGTVRLDSVGTYGVSFRTKFGNDVVAGAVIVSRRENQEWKRSTCFLACKSNILDYLTSLDSAENSIKSYQDGQYQPISEVYLDGSAEAFAYKTASGERVVLIGIVTKTLSDNTTRVYAIDDQGREWPLVNEIPYDYYQYRYLGTVKSWAEAYAPSGNTSYIPVHATATEFVSWLQSLGCAPWLFVDTEVGYSCSTADGQRVIVTGLGTMEWNQATIVCAHTAGNVDIPIAYNEDESEYLIAPDGAEEIHARIQAYIDDTGQSVIYLVGDQELANIMLLRHLNVTLANSIKVYNYLRIINNGGAHVDAVDVIVSTIDGTEYPTIQLTSDTGRFISRGTNTVNTATNTGVRLTNRYAWQQLTTQTQHTGALLGRGSTFNSVRLALWLVTRDADIDIFYNY